MKSYLPFLLIGCTIGTILFAYLIYDSIFTEDTSYGLPFYILGFVICLGGIIIRYEYERRKED